jgi:hypothetical protein
MGTLMIDVNREEIATDVVFVIDVSVKLLCKRSVSAYGNYEKVSRELSERQLKEFESFFALMKTNLAVVFRCADDDAPFFKSTIASFTDLISREQKILGDSVNLSIANDFGGVFKVSNVANVYIRFHWVVSVELKSRGACAYVLLNLKSKTKANFSMRSLAEVGQKTFLQARFSLVER